ncbi:hypothetical protein BH23CHL8_BH23CHL8_26560 [soil metagenome]
MFDDILRGLERIPEQQTISVDVVLDDDGYYDRTCPAPECGNGFKVHIEDWKAKVPDAVAHCAICGERAEPSDFDSGAQREHLQAQALAHLRGRVDDAFRSATPRRERFGFFDMRLTYEPGAPTIVVPAEASPAMTQLSECEVCGCRYASLGAAFFCPACGHNSARTTFAGALATVRASMDLVDRLPALMDDRDAAADVARHLAEDGLVRLWSSFQRFAEASYAASTASTDAPARRNAFQNLEESDRLWSRAIGMAYGDLLAADEQRDLVRLVQARHVLAHQDGLVDTDYVARSGDRRYTVGQRLVVVPAEVRRLGVLVQKLAAGLTSALGS